MHMSAFILVVLTFMSLSRLQHLVILQYHTIIQFGSLSTLINSSIPIYMYPLGTLYSLSICLTHKYACSLLNAALKLSCDDDSNIRFNSTLFFTLLIVNECGKIWWAKDYMLWLSWEFQINYIYIYAHHRCCIFDSFLCETWERFIFKHGNDVVTGQISYHRDHLHWDGDKRRKA